MGDEQNDDIRYLRIAQLAKQYGYEGLIDPTSGKYINTDGEEDDISIEDTKKLSAAGLIPPNAKLPEAGWFDDNDVYDAANKYWANQSHQTAEKHNLRTHQLAEYVRLKRAIRDKILELKNRGVQLPPEMEAFLRDFDAKKAPVYGRTDAATPPVPLNQPNVTNLGSSSMNDMAKNKISPELSSLAESIILSMNEAANQKGTSDNASDYVQTFGRNFWNGLTYGAGPETYGAAKSYANDTSAKDEIQNQRNLLAKNQKEHPYLSTAANIAGSVASPISKLGVLKSLGAAAGIGATAYGADQALGIDGETPTEGNTDAQQAATEIQMFQSVLNQRYGEEIPEDGELNDETIAAIKQHILQKYGAQL